MPTRILRDWTDSLPVDSLSPDAEQLFVRLIMKADDYGRFHADVRLVRSLCFPLKGTLRDTDMTRRLDECEKAGLIAVYETNGRKYLAIRNFRQRMRQKVAKFPPPPGKSADWQPVPDFLLSDSGPPIDCQPSDNGRPDLDNEAHLERTTTGPPSAAASKSEKESWAQNRARCWISAECPTFLKSGVASFSRLIIRLGVDEAVREVQNARDDPNVGNPFAYVEAKLDSQRAKNGARVAELPPGNRKHCT